VTRILESARGSLVWLVLAVAAATGCKGSGSAQAESADLALLCDPPTGQDTPSFLLRTFPAAAGYDQLSERLTSSRWRRWIDDVDTALSKKTADPAAGRRKADELDAAGKAAGHPSCWAAAGVRRYLDKQLSGKGTQ
jgi:hypothetical protein